MSVAVSACFDLSEVHHCRYHVQYLIDNGVILLPLCWEHQRDLTRITLAFMHKNNWTPNLLG